MSQREMPPMPKSDPRTVALRMLAAYLTATGSKPLEDRGTMPAPPGGPAGGVAFPRVPAQPPRPGSPPLVPFPTLPPAAAAHGRPTAMDVIARFVEASRARGGRA